jgi:molybdopterin converting factor subunit 1
VRIEILYFAGAREAAGRPSEAIDVPDGATVGGVRAALAARRPELSRWLPSARLAIDARFAAEAEPVAAGAVVAVIPPVSGG